MRRIAAVLTALTVLMSAAFPAAARFLLLWTLSSGPSRFVSWKATD